MADETSTDDPSIIGEEAHIVARKIDGPRGKDPLPLEQRDLYDNLILMCSIHHKIIDDQEHEYQIEKLKGFKIQHEKWVRDNLVSDIRKQKDDEIYATYIEKFIEYSKLHEWNSWTSWLIGTINLFPKEEYESLQKLPSYIVSRVWPNRYPKLEMALLNFKNVLNDLFTVLNEYIEERPDGYRTAKFYKAYNRTRDDKLINQMVDKYNFHICLFIDLVVELTRAANYVCDYIREFLFEGFRIEEGVLLISNTGIMSSNTYRVEYRGEQRIDYPYKGLRDFMEARSERDLHFGEGVEESYFHKFPWEK